MKILCSVPILTLNSEKFLARCLESLTAFADVFIVDGNSTDRTKTIAAGYGAAVYKQAETDEPNVVITNFTAVREKAEKLTACDWILFLDSDEFLSQELIEEITKVLKIGMTSQIAFAIQKKYIINGKKIEYAFNYPNYMIRLYNKASGVAFKKGKLVHEQLGAPTDVIIKKLKHCYYSELPASYRECVRKDQHQLELMKITTFRAVEKRNRSFKMAFVYALRAVNILYKSLRIYTRHGYAATLPLGQVMRHVRNHFLMAAWRLQKIFIKKYV